MNENGEKLKTVVIYTDGACLGNPGPGGYGVILIYGNHKKELSGGFRMTTNNRMELMAAIIGLEALRTKCDVTLFSDSELLVKGLSDGWAKKWRSKGWKRKKNTYVKNADLWERLLSIYQQHEVTVTWTKGHDGNWGNERSDRLAVKATHQTELQIDEMYEKDETSIVPASLFDQIEKDSEGLTVVSPKQSYTQNPPNNSQPQVNRSASTSNTKTKITKEGQPCRKCSTPVVKKIPQRKKRKPNQTYYYEYYFLCPQCHTMYMVDKVKRYFQDDNQ